MSSITPTPPGVESWTDQTARARNRGWLIGPVAAVLLVALGLFLWLAPVSNASQIEAFGGDVDRLVIDVTGGVSLEGGNHTELTITKEWLLAGEPTVVTGHDNGVARVTGECSWWQIRCITSVSGTVASDAVVEVTASAGSIDVSRTSGGVHLETSAGSVRADDVVGPARLETSAGDITGTVTNGDVAAETSSGRIALTVLGDFSSVSAGTSAGNVDLTVTDDVYDVDADTSAGTVTIEVRSDPSASRQIFAETGAGSITISPAP
jgi:hypothetical protein